MCISWPGFSNRHFAPVLTEDVGCPISISTFHKALQDCTQLIIQMPYLSLFKNCQYHLLQFARALSREGQGQRLAPCGEESPQRLGSALLGTPGDGRGVLLHPSHTRILGSSQSPPDTTTLIQLVFR